MRPSPRLAVLLTVPPLLWAGNAVIGRLAIGSMPPLTLNAARWALALALLLPLGWRVMGSTERRAQALARWPYLATIALLGVGAYNALQYLALRTSTPLNVTLIASSTPLWTLAIGALFFGERPRGRQVAGALLSLVGVAVVLSRGRLDTLLAVQFVIGDLLMLVAAAGWAFYSWMLVRPPAHMQGAARPDWTWAEFLCLQMALGLGWATAGAALLEWWWPVTPVVVQWSPWLLAALAYVAIGPSLLAYRLWGLGVAEAGPAMATIFANLTPLFAALLSAAVLGDWPQGYHALAFALIVAGIVWPARR
ncbi:DMT family transporter [Ideonella sp. A 288]|uniref:DMT family transporter n=1 Tax=Ideonella sp. A 288 TaxID=1962181 RepID=UPI000B4AD9FD|nr:DMT family transporter [Ideonella sp. A 288]